MINAIEARRQLDALYYHDSIEQLEKIDKAIRIAIEHRKSYAEIDFDINELTKKDLENYGYSIKASQTCGSLKIEF